MTTRGYIKDYPRPQFVRGDWMSLNGVWDFRFDDHNAGEQERWQETFVETHKINVPFTYETRLSGIGIEEFHPYVWYNKRYISRKKPGENGSSCIFKPSITLPKCGSTAGWPAATRAGMPPFPLISRHTWSLAPITKLR